MTVRVRFSPYQARWVRERRYHASQRDGGAAGRRPGDDAGGGGDGGGQAAGCWATARRSRCWSRSSLRAEMAAEAKKLGEIYGAP